MYAVFCCYVLACVLDEHLDAFCDVCMDALRSSLLFVMCLVVLRLCFDVCRSCVCCLSLVGCLVCCLLV